MPQRRLYLKSELAVELEKDRVTIGGALRNVPPDGELNGRPAYFMMTGFRAVYLTQDGQALDPSQERARKDKELADRTAMANAVTRAELFSGSVVTQLVVDAFSTVRTNLLALPVKVAPLVHYREELATVQAIITDAINDVLGELSERAILAAAGADTARSLEDASGLVRGAEEATAVNGQRVGRSRTAPEPGGERRARSVGHVEG